MVQFNNKTKEVETTTRSRITTNTNPFFDESDSLVLESVFFSSELEVFFSAETSEQKGIKFQKTIKPNFCSCTYDRVKMLLELVVVLMIDEKQQKRNYISSIQLHSRLVRIIDYFLSFCFMTNNSSQKKIMVFRTLNR